MAAVLDSALYVITKRGAYYRHGGCGYTNSITDAWKLPLAEAKKYEMYADRNDVPYCEKVLIEPAPTPNYATDLNAMHEAEKTLSDEQHDAYRSKLWEITYVETDFAMLLDAHARAYCNATARQRAIAFLAVTEREEG